MPTAVPGAIAVAAHGVADGEGATEGVEDTVADAVAVGVPVPVVAVAAVIGVAVDADVGIGVAFTVAAVAVAGTGGALDGGATVTVGGRVATDAVVATTTAVTVDGRGAAVRVAVPTGDGDRATAVAVPGAAPTAKNGAEKPVDATSTARPAPRARQTRERFPARGPIRGEYLDTHTPRTWGLPMTRYSAGVVLATRRSPHPAEIRGFASPPRDGYAGRNGRSATKRYPTLL